MRFSLRTLLIVMLLAGPLCAFGWAKYQAWCEWRAQQEAREALAHSRILLSFRTGAARTFQTPSWNGTFENDAKFASDSFMEEKRKAAKEVGENVEEFNLTESTPAEP